MVPFSRIILASFWPTDLNTVSVAAMVDYKRKTDQTLYLHAADNDYYNHHHIINNNNNNFNNNNYINIHIAH